MRLDKIILRNKKTLRYQKIYVIFSKLSRTASIIIRFSNCLMQIIFVGYDILHHVINKPMRTIHPGCPILNKCKVPQIKAA